MKNNKGDIPAFRFGLPGFNRSIPRANSPLLVRVRRKIDPPIFDGRSLCRLAY